MDLDYVDNVRQRMPVSTHARPSVYASTVAIVVDRDGAADVDGGSDGAAAMRCAGAGVGAGAGAAAKAAPGPGSAGIDTSDVSGSPEA